MRTEEFTVSLTVIETELLLAALTHYEHKFQKERSEGLADDIRVLRGKLLGTS